MSESNVVAVAANASDTHPPLLVILIVKLIVRYPKYHQFDDVILYMY